MPIKVCSETYFFRLEVLYRESEISDSGPAAQSPSRRTCAQDFYIHRPQSGLNPRTLDPEASTLPRDHRGRHPTP